VLDIAGKDVPVHMGAESKNDLGKPNRAVDFMLERVNKNPGEVTMLALAPCTNLATAMMLDTGFASKLKDIVIMGGSINFKPFSFFGEFNFHLDGRAASFALSAPVPKTLITMDVCSQAVFREEHLKEIQAKDTKVTRYLTEVIPHWLNLNRMIFFRKKGFFPWDVVAAAYIVDSRLFDENPYYIKIQEKGVCSGKIISLEKAYDAMGPDKKPAVNIPLHLDSMRFMEMFIGAMN
jgi:purine nucleosidase